jgi:hypothetical protein
MSIIYLRNAVFGVILIVICIRFSSLLANSSNTCREDAECPRFHTCFWSHRNAMGHCIPFYPVNKTLCHERCQSESVLYEREFWSRQAQHFMYFPSVTNDTCVVGFRSVPLLNVGGAAPEKPTGVVVSRENLWREWFVVMCHEL